MLLFSYDETNIILNNTYARAGKVHFTNYRLYLTRVSSTTEPTYKGIILYNSLNDKCGEQIILDKNKLILLHSF